MITFPVIDQYYLQSSNWITVILSRGKNPHTELSLSGWDRISAQYTWRGRGVVEPIFVVSRSKNGLLVEEETFRGEQW